MRLFALLKHYNMKILTRSDDVMLIHSRWEGVAGDSNKQINFPVDEAKTR